MTLAPTRPDAFTPADQAGVAAPSVSAVLLSRRDPRGMGELLEAVLGQALPPDEVLVLDRTDAAPTPRVPASGEAGTPDTADAGRDEVVEPAPEIDLAAIVEAVASTRGIPVTVRSIDPRTPVRVAIRDAVREREPAPELPGEPLVWILPVGAVPEKQALVRLVDEWRRSPSAGLIGPKHVDAGNPLMLRALSIGTTRGGRLSSRPRPGEPDQGQYDQSTDVLAVPLAGSLIERSLLLQLRGWEPFFGDVGADLDLGWRAHIAGRRVVVVPSARVRTERGV
ncbi:MAG: glycosyltransferase family 2 protein, partial [Ornithinibacter sp.]